MIYYIKVTPEVAKRFCNPVLRNYFGGQKDNDTPDSEATDKGSEETSEDDEADGNNKEKEA